MKKRVLQFLALLCNALGTIAALYVGGWMMFLRPIHMLFTAFGDGTLNAYLVLVCGVKILLSATFAGLVWCIGYIGCNYFKGDEEPDWNLINERAEEKNLVGKEN